MPCQTIALEAYETLADAYASVIDTKPHNAYYERPATLSLLPDVQGKRVLDAGCGPGVYSEWLMARGATVVSIDISPRMVELARERLDPRADVRIADLAEPLDFLADASFDVVLSPLVLEYVEDWLSTFREFHRVLRPGGCFVFSVTHPFSDFTYFKSDDYYATEHVSCTWKGFEGVRVKMPSIRRPLEAMLNPLCEAGFRLDKTLEPKVTKELEENDPEHFTELSRQPCFICFRAVK